MLWRGFGFTQGSELGRQSAVPCHAMPCHAMSCSTYGEHQQNINMHATVATENIHLQEARLSGRYYSHSAIKLRGNGGQLTLRSSNGQQSGKVMLCRLVMGCIARNCTLINKPTFPVHSLSFSLQVAFVCRGSKFLRFLWLPLSLSLPF